MKKAAFILLALIWLTPSCARSDDLPSGLYYYSDPGTSASFYATCVQSSPIAIKCTFSKIEVTKGKARPEEDPSTVPDDELKTFSSPEMCSGVSQFSDAIASGKLLEGVDKAAFEKFLKKTGQAKTDTINWINSMARMCKNPTRDNLVSLSNVMNDKQVRTCEFSHWEFTTEFQSSSGIWISSIPRGSDNCGTVDISSFQRAPDANDHWTYKEKTVVSNKDAKSFGKPCRDVEADQTYDWKPEDFDVFLRCDYIKFGTH